MPQSETPKWYVFDTSANEFRSVSRLYTYIRIPKSTLGPRRAKELQFDLAALASLSLCILNITQNAY